jgi:hypothetical protein
VTRPCGTTNDPQKRRPASVAVETMLLKLLDVMIANQDSATVRQSKVGQIPLHLAIGLRLAAGKDQRTPRRR